jgi:DNA processing protein
MVAVDNREASLPKTVSRARESLAGPIDTMLTTTIPSQVALGDPGYPTRLAVLGDAPGTLWFVGRLPAPEAPAIAIVGSRAATGAGRTRARSWAAALARRGFVVISGGAFGIDAAAHEGALDADAATFAVLGCGADVVYPDRHTRLFARIATRGGLLSELPPGTPPRPWHFPRRNRLIAALADTVLVVEAAPRSGALITATLAEERGQRLLAAPGSPGTDALIARGAVPVTSVETLGDALEGRAVPPPPPIPPRHEALLTALGDGAHSPGALAQRLGLSLPSVMGLLMEAELAGRVRRAEGSQYEVLRGH